MKVQGLCSPCWAQRLATDSGPNIKQANERQGKRLQSGDEKGGLASLLPLTWVGAVDGVMDGYKLGVAEGLVLGTFGIHNESGNAKGLNPTGLLKAGPLTRSRHTLTLVGATVGGRLGP